MPMRFRQFDLPAGSYGAVTGALFAVTVVLALALAG